MKIWFLEIEFIRWKKWHSFVNARLDELVRNAGSTFVNVSARIDELEKMIIALQHENIASRSLVDKDKR